MIWVLPWNLSASGFSEQISSPKGHIHTIHPHRHQLRHILPIILINGLRDTKMKEVRTGCHLRHQLIVPLFNLLLKSTAGAVHLQPWWLLLRIQQILLRPDHIWWQWFFWLGQLSRPFWLDHHLWWQLRLGKACLLNCWSEHRFI